MKRDQTIGPDVDHRARTKAEALAILSSVKGNVRFRLHAAVSAIPSGPYPRLFRACVPLSRPEAVRFIEDAFHPYHEKEGYLLPITVSTGARKARFVNGQSVEYGKPAKFVYIG